MTEPEFVERIFGSEQCAVLYLSSDLLKSIKARPGNKVRITPVENGFTVKVDNPRPGGPT
jgi:hypothetical protein